MLMTNEYYIKGYQDACDMTMALVRNGYTVVISQGYKPSDYWENDEFYIITVAPNEKEKNND